jgi:hypothetical protein
MSSFTPSSQTADSTAEPTPPQWYIVKQSEGFCDICPSSLPTSSEHWGPFASQAEAIARRVGLIRAGKCQPR